MPLVSLVGPQPASIVNGKAERQPQARQSRRGAAERALPALQQAAGAEPSNLLAGLNLVECLVVLNRREAGVQEARRVLAILNHAGGGRATGWEDRGFPPFSDVMQKLWVEIDQRHAGDCDAKRALLRWRLHLLLAELTGKLPHYYEAVLARPDLPVSQAALGCALARQGRVAEAVDHLRRAVAGDPSDRAAARALFHALGESGERARQARLAGERRLLARATPQVVPVEPWFPDPHASEGSTDSPRPCTRGRGVGGEAAALAQALSPLPLPLSPEYGGEGIACAGEQSSISTQLRNALSQRVSLCMIVKNEEQNLPECLASAKDLVDEIIVIDTGSTDRTCELATAAGARVHDFAWVDDFAAARNEGLRHATGDWIFWLDADDRLDEANRQRLRALFARLGQNTPPPKPRADENHGESCDPEPYGAAPIPLAGVEQGFVTSWRRAANRPHPACRGGARVHLHAPENPRTTPASGVGTAGSSSSLLVTNLCSTPASGVGANGDGYTYENVAYVMKCVCLPDPRSRTTTVVDHVRLFRNDPLIRWSYRVHEQILPAVRQTGGSVRWTDIVIHHVGYQDPALRRQKLDRDLRLLQLQDAETPDEPFTLFNLGSVYHELGRSAEALVYLQNSLELSQPAASIVRKLYALIVQCLREQGKQEEALAACRKGRSYYADDPELLFQEGLALREKGELAGAEARFLELLRIEPQAHFASVDMGLRGCKARHNLAVLYLEQGRTAEAETQWRAALAEQPDFLPASLGLAELYLEQERWPALEEALGRLEQDPQAAVEAVVLRARGHLARKEFTAARQLLEETIERHPQALRPRVILSHVLLQEGRDWAAAEQALRAVLALDPGHKEAQRNLAVLERQLRHYPPRSSLPRHSGGWRTRAPG